MDIHYNAFISYRHHPADIKVAEQIHKGLEHYRIPKALKKKNASKMRLFRDKEELPITSNLTDDITRALENSDFLIVICSPHTKESVWVQREIETFLKTHDHSRILTVIADGEPYDVIPEILCSQERIDPVTGETSILPIEPLSCDWRSGKRKAYREELPRLAAALLGCGYDELRQRERQYRTRRLVAVFSAVLAAVVGFSAYVVYNSLQIQKANDQLEAANNQLQDANIAIQNNLTQAQINQAQFLASASEQQAEAGDRMLALALAMEALPEENEQRPYVARAEKALADAVGAYVAQSKVAAVGVISCEAFINHFAPTDERDYMFVTDQRNLLSVWNLDTYLQTAAIPLEKAATQLLITPADTLIVSDSYSLRCYDTQLNLKWQAEEISSACLSEDRTVVIAAGKENTLFLLDAATGKQVGQSLQILLQPEDLNRWGISFRQEFYDPEKPILLDYNYYDEISQIISADLTTGTFRTVATIPAEFDIRSTAYTGDGNILALAIGTKASWNSLFNQMMTNSEVPIRLACFTPEGKELWTTDLTSYTYTGTSTLYNLPGTNRVFCQADNHLLVLDAPTGKIISHCQTSGTPLWVQPNEDHVGIITEDGTIGSYTYNDNQFNSYRYFKDNLNQALAGKGCFVKQVYSTEILCYTNVSDENWQIFDGEYNPTTSHWAACGNLVAIYNYDSICVFDAKARKLLWDIPESSGDRFQLLEFTNNGKYLWFVNKGTIVRVNMENGRQTIATLPERHGEAASFYYSSNSRVCMDDGVIYTIAEAFSTNALYVVTLNTGNFQKTVTPVKDVAWDSFVDACELRIAKDGIAYLWFGKTGTLYQVNTNTQETSVFMDGLTSAPYLQYLKDGSTYMLSVGHEVRFYNNDGTLLFTDTLKDVTGVSAYRTSQNEYLVLLDSGDIYRYSPSGQRLGETAGHLYSSFPSNIGENFEAELIRWIETGDGDLFLGIFQSGNLIDMDCWELRAWVPNCVAYLPATDQFITTGFGENRADKLGAFPRYTTEDIRAMAKEALAGYGLTDKQKAYYGIS